ncbi:isoleucine patch superfamily enzyme, carbonic anhydrase/acetyltransferase [Xenococcus sp. PCC 7305]|uniref:gamma carbonic anhydrase family protein n=1 Tax=Xenococcus sp. PCC 7305 TaxID=102125 RepID=UPI0002ABC937|nr:gamma carbonic anhydrase family protein [Xenococcus sp. PCC 7305]ELS05290.1 isoleucine patch superfamily enzyme, carbonic anhydrase/acetyltransferase [Xenococcus sp. PCC 7305]
MNKSLIFNGNFDTPDLSAAAFVANNATVIGDVSIGVGANIWYNAVVRADLEKIVIGKYTNIQDGAVLHGDPGLPTILDDYVTIGHQAVVHSAHIERGCLIGIGAVILDGVTVGTGSIIGAGCIVTKDVAERSLMVGVPAKKIRDITEEKAQDLIKHAQQYYELALAHAQRISK